MVKDRSGITIVELILVMSLIGIVTSIAAPSMRSERFRMDGSVLTVASTLSAQQRNAVMRQHNIVLAFDTVNGTVRVHYDLDNDNAVDAGENTKLVELDDGSAFGRGSTTARPMSSSSISLSNTQDGLPALTFRRNGSASEEAIIYLTSQRWKVAGGSAYPDDGRAVEIERATGRIRCYSHNTGAWSQTC